MARELNKLTNVQVKQAQAREKSYRLPDGGGLYLQVEPNGSKYWRLRYRMQGVERAPFALGVYPHLSLAEARKAASVARDQIRQGIDPGTLRKSQKIIDGNTFRTVAAAWHQRTYQSLSPGQAKRVWRNLELHVLPQIGDMPIDRLQAIHFVSVLHQLETRGTMDVAKRTGRELSKIMDFAVARGLCPANTADAPARTLRPKPPAKHHPAFKTLAEVGDFLCMLRHYPGDLLTLHGIHLLLLTSVRTSELRFAQWDEIDLAKGTWKIKAARTKMRKPHTVYLSRQACRLLQDLHALTGHTPHVFAKDTKIGVLSENFCTQAIRRMGLYGKISGHGFRGTLSTILNEEGHFRPDVIEAALAHSDKDAVRSAYNHAGYEKELRSLWQWWADALDAAENASAATATSAHAPDTGAKPSAAAQGEPSPRRHA